jgi:hypothetical protein
LKSKKIGDFNNDQLEKISASRSDKLSHLEELVKKAKQEQKMIESEQERRGMLFPDSN